MADQTTAHWDAAYARDNDTPSWLEKRPDMSLRMLDSAGVSAADALIDVGGGACPLSGALLDRGFRDLTVVDISATGIQYARDRLAPDGPQHCLGLPVARYSPAQLARQMGPL